MIRKNLTLAALLTVFGGGMFLTTPAKAAPATFDCAASANEYCQIIADTYCTHGAVCRFTTYPECHVVDAECY